MKTINGIGTMLYGSKFLTEQEISASGIVLKTNRPYISTKWFTFLFIPLIPLGSYIVLGESKGTNHFFSSTREYNMVSTNINWTQVLYGWIIAVIILSVLYMIDNK